MRFASRLRFNILNNYVDYFVIVESNKTWQNNPKNFNFNVKKFSKILAIKLFISKVEDMPDGENPWFKRKFSKKLHF